MKQITKYQCEICGKICDTMAEAHTCEANHFGLTYQEYMEWKKISRDAAQAGQAVSVRKSPETNADFSKALNKLINFDKRHSITAPHPKFPSDFYC